PKERSSTTLRPLGPRVTFTALARTFTPRTTRARASSPNKTCLAAMLISLNRDNVEKGDLEGSIQVSERLLDHRQDLFFTDNQQFVAIDLDGLAGVLAEQNLVANFDVDRQHFAVFGFLARANGQDFTLIGLFSGAIGDDDA